MSKSRLPSEPAALELIEEAVHVLRRAPAASLAIYYAGTVPFVLGGLYFWARAGWFQPAAEQVAWGALGLVGLFAGMKAAQAEFCHRLLAARLGAPVPAWSWRRLGRQTVAQLRLQPWALLASLVAGLLTVPFGWVYAYAQNLVVLGDDERRHEEAVAQARLWPNQNHLGLLLLSVLAAGVWINLGAAFVAVPWLATKLLGLESIFGFSGWWFLNTTFFASVTGLTWLAVDPLVKAFYTLRVFHGQARRTGEDLRVELRRVGRPAAVLRAALGLGLALLVSGEAMRAGEAPPPGPAVVRPAELDRAIDRVLAEPGYRWRLRPVPGAETKTTDGTFKRFVREGVDTVAEMVAAAIRAVRSVVDWFERNFSGGDAGAERAGTEGGAGGVSAVRGLLYAFLVVVAGLLIWILVLTLRSSRRRPALVVTARAVTAAVPDLADERLQAAQLPTEGWLALAHEQAGRGEWRLALRALYLASLTRLAAEGLVTLARSKTNLDYEREVRRRALSRVELAAQFARRRRTFEDVWYGNTPAAEAEVRAWLHELGA